MDTKAGSFGLDGSEACFVYRPSTAADTEPPMKKRKTGPTKAIGGQVSQSVEAFPSLLDGKESPECRRARAAAFERLWRKKETQLENVLDGANAEIADQVVAFIGKGPDTEVLRPRIPTGLISADLASSASGSIFDFVAQRINGDKTTNLIRVHASECHNLKASLKAIISRGTAITPTAEDEEEELIEQKGGRRHLNYDLQALYEFASKRGSQRTVLFFQNSEALDPYILAELVDVLSSWQDRLPTVLLFEIAVSTDLFQEKLPQSTVRQLDGAAFASKSASEVLDMLFCAATMAGPDNSLYLGAAASRLLLDRQTEFVGSAKSFLSSLKYMYMMHFFNNPLSWLCLDEPECELQKEHATLLRNLPSFSKHAQQLVNSGAQAEARKLARDQSHLLQAAPQLLSDTRAALWSLQHALEILAVIHDLSPARANLTYSTLYTKALGGELADSPIVRELLTAAKKLPSDSMQRLLERLSGIPIIPAAALEAEAAALRAATSKATGPLRSSYDDANEVTRAAVVGQKVVLNKARAKPAAGEAVYSKLAERVEALLAEALAGSLVAPRELCFSEVLVYDSKSAAREALGPSPRAAVERALSRPHDYLACACCDVPAGALAASQPATALVYQMYCESGTQINIQDLWMAFQSLLAPEDGEGSEKKDEEVLAMFHRALAELRYLGMIKQSKKKADHLMKVRWKGV